MNIKNNPVYIAKILITKYTTYKFGCSFKLDGGVLSTHVTHIGNKGF